MHGKREVIYGFRVSDKLLEELRPEERAVLLMLQREPLECVNNPAFDEPGAEKRIMAQLELDKGKPIQRFIQAVADPIGELDKRNGTLGLNGLREALDWFGRVEKIRDQLANANLPLVLAMAKRTRLSNVDFSELISEGNMALLRALDKFDVGRGFKFSTYGCRAILKAFSRASQKQSRYRNRFPAEFDPDMEKSDYLERRREDLLADSVEELHAIIHYNLAGLNEVEDVIIRERFALSDNGDQPKPKTLEQVGRIIGVTKERVRQLQNKALRKIKKALESEVIEHIELNIR
jgi:RNA polymerase sigma factor (sigma-70 family)